MRNWAEFWSRSAQELNICSTTQKVFSSGTTYSRLVKLSPDDETLSLLGSLAPQCNLGKKYKWLMGSLHRQVAVLVLDEKLNCFDF